MDPVVKAGEDCTFAAQFHGEADVKTIQTKKKTTIDTHSGCPARPKA